MRSSTSLIIALLICVLCMAGCSVADIRVDSQKKASLDGNRIVVLPFYDPCYKGQQLIGIGRPFAAVFTNKLRAAGMQASVSTDNEFSSVSIPAIQEACRYAAVNGYTMFITGAVTEWIDGATSWSGKVDVAAISVKVYNTKTCEMARSASGREQGTWFTLLDQPTTRFYEPLSEAMVDGLMK